MQHTLKPVLCTGGWDATCYVQQSHDESPVSVLGSRDENMLRQFGFAGQPGVLGDSGAQCGLQSTGLYMLPLEYTISSDEPEVGFLCHPAAWIAICVHCDSSLII